MSEIQTVPPEVPNTDITPVIVALTTILKTKHVLTKDEKQKLENLKAEIDRPRGPAEPSGAMDVEDLRKEMASHPHQNPGLQLPDQELELPPGDLDMNIT